MKKVICAVMAMIAMVSMTTLAHADLLASDDFSYADGSLVPNGGWAGHSGNPGDLLVSSGQAVVQHGTPSEDASLSFIDVSKGILTADFDLSVNDDTAIGGSDFEYFAHFFTDGSFNFRSRVDIVAGSSGGDFSLGISSGSSTAEATLTNDFNFGDVIAVQLAFNLDTGIGSLTANGETITGTTPFTGEVLNRFALRQSDSSNNETIFVDNLRINGIPEPGSAAVLVAFAGLGMVRRRK